MSGKVEVSLAEALRCHGLNGAHADAGAGGPSPRLYGRFKVRTLGDEVAQLARPYLVKGLFYKGDLIFVTGEPGSGKTTLMQYVALAIAQGKPIFGRRVIRGRVLYLAFEGKELFLQKMIAHERVLGTSRDLVYMTQPMTLLEGGPYGEDANQLVEMVKGERADLVVCDTWSKMMAGSDDNSHKDASGMIRVLDRVREETGAAVAVIAHPNRTNPNDVSGSLTVRKDSDAMILVSGTSGTRTVESLKLRFGKIGHEFSFALDQVVLGKDADGDDVTSVALTEVTSEKSAIAGAPKLSPAYAMVWKHALNLLASPDGTVPNVVPSKGMPRVTAVLRERLIGELQAAGQMDSGRGSAMTATDRSKLRAALAALDRKGLLGSNDQWVWKLGACDAVH